MIEGYLRRLGLMASDGPVDYLDPKKMNLSQAWPTGGRVDSGMNPQMSRPVRQWAVNPADYADEPQSSIGKAIDDYRAHKRDDTPAAIASGVANIATMPLKMMTLEGMAGLAHDVGRAVQTPYNVMTSPEPVTTEQMVEPAANIALTAPMAAAGAHAAGVRVAPREIVAANSKDAALPGLLANTRDTVSSLAQAWGETPQQFMDRAVAGDASRSNMLMGALKGSGIDAAQIPGAVRDTYRGGQYSVAEAKQRIRDLDAEFGKLYVKHNNNEKAVLADPAYGPLNEEMKALTGGALPKEPSRFAQGFEALPSSRKFDLFSNSENAALPGLLRSAQAGEQQKGITAYHGTGRDWERYDLNADKVTGGGLNKYGMALSPDPKVASRYATSFNPDGGGRVLPTVVDAQKPLELSASNYERLQSLVGKIDRKEPLTELDHLFLEDVVPGYREGSHPIENIKSAGHDAITKDAGKWGIAEPEILALRPGMVKSKITGETLFSNPREASPLAAALAGEQMQQPGITAYHGSPHDFDRFSMDKIGTGEGAQAYGHGLYFAENEAIAKAYRDSLSKHNPASYVDPSLQQIRAKHDALVESITDELNRIGKSPLDENLPPHIKAKLDELTKIVPQYDNRPGRMYEVRINADPEHFLDWDKPLSQQSEKVRDAALGIRNAAARAEYEKRGFPEPLIQEYLGNASKADKTGAQLVQGMKGANQSADFSSQLRAAGIPGIKYLDQGSRTAGEGSRNFVVFDDKLISIVRKYGWAGAAAMLGMSTDDLMSQAQAQQPEKPDPYREALRMKARAKVLGLTP